MIDAKNLITSPLKSMISTIVMNKIGHLHIWAGDKKVEQSTKYNYLADDKESDLYIQDSCSVEAIFNELNGEEANSLNNGYTVKTKNLSEEYFSL